MVAASQIDEASAATRIANKAVAMLRSKARWRGDPISIAYDARCVEQFVAQAEEAEAAELAQKEKVANAAAEQLLPED